MAKPLSRVFLENARQRLHGRLLHGKGSLPCAFCRTHGKGPLSCVKDGTRQNKGANGGTTKMAQACLCYAPPNKTHDKYLVFVVRFS
jgi:hypothetical protein